MQYSLWKMHICTTYNMGFNKFIALFHMELKKKILKSLKASKLNPIGWVSKYSWMQTYFNWMKNIQLSHYRTVIFSKCTMMVHKTIIVPGSNWNLQWCSRAAYWKRQRDLTGWQLVSDWGSRTFCTGQWYTTGTEYRVEITTLAPHMEYYGEK